MSVLRLEIDGFSRYLIGDDGTILNKRFDRLVAVHQNKTRGWVMVSLVHDDGRQRFKSVARLVAEAFLPPPVPPETSVVNRDGDRTNNRVENLAWLSRSRALVFMREMQDPSYFRERLPICLSGRNLIFSSIAEVAAHTLLWPSMIEEELGNDKQYVRYIGV